MSHNLLAFVLIGSSLLGSNCETLVDTDEETSIELTSENTKKKNLRLSRQDQIPEERLKEETASYLEGYIQALIDANYYELNVLEIPENGSVLRVVA